MIMLNTVNEKDSAAMSFCCVLKKKKQAKSIRKEPFTNCSLHRRRKTPDSVLFFSPLFCSSDTMAWESKVSFRCSRGVSSTFLRLKVGDVAVTWSPLKNAHRLKKRKKKTPQSTLRHYLKTGLCFFFSLFLCQIKCNSCN